MVTSFHLKMLGFFAEPTVPNEMSRVSCYVPKMRMTESQFGTRADDHYHLEQCQLGCVSCSRR